MRGWSFCQTRPLRYPLTAADSGSRHAVTTVHLQEENAHQASFGKVVRYGNQGYRPYSTAKKPRKPVKPLFYTVYNRACRPMVPCKTSKTVVISWFL